MAKEVVTAFVWAKFVVGAALLAWMLYIHVYVKELSYFIMAIPGVLMGVIPVTILEAILPGKSK